MNSAGHKRAIGELSGRPSAYTEQVTFSHSGGAVELGYVYERNGSMYAGGVRFHRTRAYRFRTEGHCTPWHVEDCYDTLVEVEQSRWVSELLAAQPSGTPWLWAIRHFLIYIDDAGAYEVAAERCEWLPEQPVA